MFAWSLSNLIALLRFNLFTHRELWSWLNNPFDTLPIPYDQKQFQLKWAWVKKHKNEKRT
jgi:hypothetical protein